MPPVQVILANSEDASGNAEFRVGGELMAATFLYDGRLHLRIEPRPDGEPWLIEAAALELALEDAARQIAEH